MMNNDCNCNKSFTTVSEYPCRQPACIRKKQPECLATAVIPAVNVDTTDGILNLADCFVHVTSNNTTYYIDDKHRPMFVWAGPVEVDNYDYSANPLGLKNQFCLGYISDVFTEIYFDKRGVAHIIGTEA